MNFSYTCELTMKDLLDLLAETPDQNIKVYNKLKKSNELNRNAFINKMITRIAVSHTIDSDA